MIDIDSYIRQVNTKENVAEEGTSPCYHFGDVVLVKYVWKSGIPREGEEEIAKQISQKKAKGVRTPAHLAIKRETTEEGNICWVLQEAAKGKLKTEEYPKTVLQAPDNHYEQLIHDLCELLDMGIEPKDKNIFYDPDPEKGGFTIIDILGTEKKPFENKFSDVYWVFACAKATVQSYDFSDEENMEAYRRCFLAMEKAIPNFSKHRRNLLRTFDKKMLEYFSKNNVEIGDLTLTMGEMAQFKKTEREMLQSCLEEISSGKLKYWQLTANEFPNRSEEKGLTDSWKYHPLNPLRPDDFSDDWDYRSECKKMREDWQKHLFDQMLKNTPDDGNPYLTKAKADMPKDVHGNPFAEDDRNLHMVFVSFSEHSFDGIDILEEKPDLLNKSLQRTGMPPIFMAMRANDENAIKYLLQKGVNLTLKDTKNRTILDYLPDVSSEQLKEAISSLYTAQMNTLKNQIAKTNL